MSGLTALIITVNFYPEIRC